MLSYTENKLIIVLLAAWLHFARSEKVKRNLRRKQMSTYITIKLPVRLKQN